MSSLGKLHETATSSAATPVPASAPQSKSLEKHVGSTGCIPLGERLLDERRLPQVLLRADHTLYVIRTPSTFDLRIRILVDISVEKKEMIHR